MDQQQRSPIAFYPAPRIGYLTVVRDIDSEAVLLVGKGKEAGVKRGPHARQIRKKQIKAVTIDMANSYAA